ncbi:MAG: hypothetical protein HY911_04995 [Desulfobacterales bacterium]|nr:hypothetical protein [Desulfobacterales bacterium]
MKHLSLTQKLCMAGWLLAAAILAAINGLPFSTLAKASTGADPANLIALRAKLSLLETLAAANLRQLSDRERLQSFFAAYHPPKDADSTETTPAAAADTPGDPAPAQAALPGLAGVLQRVDVLGRPHYLAVLDGRVCAEKDEVRLFTVGAITADGVVLQRAGMQWFLPTPQPYYTSDQGH